MYSIDGSTITTFQGDSVDLKLKGFTKAGTVYFSVFDENYKIKSEISKDVTGEETEVSLHIPAKNTDDLTYTSNDDGYVDYYYGLKFCYTEDEEEYEDTVLVGGDNPSNLNIFRIYPKRVEGTTESN